MVSVKNIVGVATGTKSLGALGKEALGRVVTPHVKQSASAPAMSYAPAAVQSAPVLKSAAAQTLMKKGGGGVTIGQVLTGAAGGALQGAGVAMSGDKNVKEVGADVIDDSIEAWFKRHALKVVAAVVAVAGFLMWKKGQSPARGRKR